MRPENLEQALDQVLARFVKAQPKPDDLQRGKTQLIAGTIYRRDDQYAMASAYGQALMIGLTADDVDGWPDRIRAVGAADVQAAARAALDKKEAVSAWLVPQPAK